MTTPDAAPDAGYNEVASVQDDLDHNLADSPSARRTELRADVAVMIELNVAEWNGIRLREAAFHPRVEAPEEPTQQRRSPDEIARQLRIEREQLMSRAVGGPVKRGGSSDQ